MSPSSDAVIERTIAALNDAGARFAYLHGSRAEGREHERSDVDIAAFFGRPLATSFGQVSGLPDGVDLLVLDHAPLELAGRVALRGRLLFEADPAERVRWEADTRRIYLDERPRIEQARRDFVEAAKARGRR